MSGKVPYINNKGSNGSKNSKAKDISAYSEIKKLPKRWYAKNKWTKPDNIIDVPHEKKYTYSTNYDGDVSDFLKKIHKNLGIIDEPNRSALDIWNTSINSYNRFKLPIASDKLQRGFAHIFFVRPSCNLTTNNGASLTTSVKNNQIFDYVMKQSPELIKELVMDNGKTHQFMMSLSNHIVSFSPNDEVLETSMYGTTYTGYKIAYGKNNIDSKTAGTLSINFQDDKQMHIYQLHKLWIEYISGVYRGSILPRTSDVMNKIIDYMSAIYYFILAEDNETILFWSKYYGVFPSSLPTEQFAWASGNTIKNADDISITYNYSFKKDYEPIIISEFNKNSNVSGISNLEYAPTYDESLHSIGQTWVGRPYVEKVKNGSQYFYKLRFISK